MIDYPTWSRMQELHEQNKLNAAQIARELGLSPRTVRTWLGQPYRPRKIARRERERQVGLGTLRPDLLDVVPDDRASAVEALFAQHVQDLHP